MITRFEPIKEYIFEYISKYRKEYQNFVESPPKGPGYPSYNISPYLIANSFEVYMAKDGIILNLITKEPEYKWYIAGGPAVKVDYEPTRTPPQINKILKDNGLVGKEIGIYRVVTKKNIPSTIWTGQINFIKETKYNSSSLDTTLYFKKVNIPINELLCAMTFGAFGIVLDLKLPDSSSPIGEPYIIEKIGFFPADLNNRRFITYLEIYPHIDSSAWDDRIINAIVKNSIRRDFVKPLSNVDENGGTILFGDPNQFIENYTNRLTRLKSAIDEFRKVLMFQAEETEDVFHKLLEKYPLLLDVYGNPESKPKLYYPHGESSPIGKSYLEPDFIITYPDNSYKLIEIERPSKKIATKQGQPRAEVGQALFQIAEWKHYIKEYYNEIKKKYPGIHTKYSSCVIMSRSSQKSFNNLEEMDRYKQLILNQYSVSEIITYDDLFERACAAYTILTGLSPEL